MLDLPCPFIGRPFEDSAKEPSKSTVRWTIHRAPRPDHTNVLAPLPVVGVVGVVGRVAARLKGEASQTGTCCFCLHEPAVK